jgi:hypothetical protein
VPNVSGNFNERYVFDKMVKLTNVSFYVGYIMLDKITYVSNLASFCVWTKSLVCIKML